MFSIFDTNNTREKSEKELQNCYFISKKMQVRNEIGRKLKFVQIKKKNI